MVLAALTAAAANVCPAAHAVHSMSPAVVPALWKKSAGHPVAQSPAVAPLHAEQVSTEDEASAPAAALNPGAQSVQTFELTYWLMVHSVAVHVVGAPETAAALLVLPASQAVHSMSAAIVPALWKKLAGQPVAQPPAVLPSVQLAHCVTVPETAAAPSVAPAAHAVHSMSAAVVPALWK